MNDFNKNIDNDIKDIVLEKEAVSLGWNKKNNETPLAYIVRLARSAKRIEEVDEILGL